MGTKYIFLSMLVAAVVLVAAPKSHAAFQCNWRYDAQFTQIADQFKRNLSDSRFLKTGLDSLCKCFDKAKKEGTDVNECSKQTMSMETDPEKLKKLGISLPEHYDEDYNYALMSDEEKKKKFHKLDNQGNIINQNSGKPLCYFPKKTIYKRGTGWVCQ